MEKKYPWVWINKQKCISFFKKTGKVILNSLHIKTKTSHAFVSFPLIFKNSSLKHSTGSQGLHEGACLGGAAIQEEGEFIRLPFNSHLPCSLHKMKKSPIVLDENGGLMGIMRGLRCPYATLGYYHQWNKMSEETVHAHSGWSIIPTLLPGGGVQDFGDGAEVLMCWVTRLKALESKWLYFLFLEGCFLSLECPFLLAPAQMLGAASMGKEASIPRRPRTGQLGQLLLLASGKASPGALFCLGLSLHLPSGQGSVLRRVSLWQGLQRGWTLVRAFRPRDQRHPWSSPSVTRSPYILMKDTNEFSNSLPALPSSLLLLSPLLPWILSLICITWLYFLWVTSSTQNSTPHLCPEGCHTAHLQNHILSFLYLIYCLIV